uniref:Uncharacterized protein n=1 Tax=Tanacetum cinerariifolium TaxID=118510 RepID=A0A699H9U7_TANCI|nr:hypothetical protein [Tanacetum cinerariifolium]
MELSKKLSDRVLDLEKIKTSQAKDIVDLKKRARKKAEKERDELKLTLEKYQNSSESLNTLLERQGITYYLKPDLMFIDKQVKSKPVDVVFNVTSSGVKTVESKVEYVDVKNKGVYNTIETKRIKKNNFSPPIIEDWNSDDEKESKKLERKRRSRTLRMILFKIDTSRGRSLGEEAASK